MHSKYRKSERRFIFVIVSSCRRSSCEKTCHSRRAHFSISRIRILWGTRWTVGWLLREQKQASLDSWRHAPTPCFRRTRVGEVVRGGRQWRHWTVRWRKSRETLRYASVERLRVDRSPTGLLSALSYLAAHPRRAGYFFPASPEE